MLVSSPRHVALIVDTIIIHVSVCVVGLPSSSRAARACVVRGRAATASRCLVSCAGIVCAYELWAATVLAQRKWLPP